MIIYGNPQCSRVFAFNRYLESKQFDEILLTNKRHLDIHKNKNSTVIDKYLEDIAKREKDYQTLFEGYEGDYHKIDKKDMENFISSKIGELPLSRDLRKIFFCKLIV